MVEKKLVVGVDETRGSLLALRWALDEAALRGASVQAVAVWDRGGLDHEWVAQTSTEALEEPTRAVLGDQIRRALADYEGNAPPVEEKLVHGADAGPLLAEAATGAELLVVGSHGHGRLRHAALGSTSEKCTQQATCPVVIVPLPHD
jgi:nucleotide-binding universal stress UspA family protein